MDIDGILGSLDKVRPTGRDTWRSRCPSCGDKNQTKLSIKDAGNGVTLMHCFAGCSVDEIVGAMGLKLEDLMPPKRDHGKKLVTPFRREAFAQLKGDLNVVWVLLNDISRGRELSEADRKKAGEYGRRVANLLSEIS